MSQLATFPTVAYQLCLNQFANDPAPPAAVWTDITSRVRGDDGSSVRTSRGRQYELGQAEAGTAQMRWRNEDGAFTLGGSNALSGLALYRKARMLATLAGGNLSPQDFTVPGTQWLASNGTLLTAVALCGPMGQVGTSGVVTAGAAGSVSVTATSRPAVTPSTVYSVLGYFQAVTVGRSCTAQVNWYDNVGALIRTDSVSSVVSAVGSWVKSAGLVTSPVNAAFGAVTLQIAGAAGAGEQHYVAGPALIPGTVLVPDWQPYTSVATKNVWAGLAERLPIKWDLDGVYGACEPVLVDALAGMAQTDLDRVVSAEILLDAPLAYYPLQEPSTSATAGDSSGNNNGALTPVSTKYGTSTMSFGQATTLVDSDVCVKFAPPGTVTASQAATWLQSGGPMVPANVNGTVEFWGFFGSTAPAGTYSNAKIVVQGDPGQFAAQYLTVDILTTATANPGKLYAALNILGSAVTVTSAGSVCDGKWHHIVVTLTRSGANTTIQVWLDGVSQGTGVVAVNSAIFNLGFVQVGGYVDTANGINGAQMPCQVAHLAIYGTVLSSTRIASHYASGTTGFTGETSGARVTRLLSYGPFSGVRSIDAGTSVMGPATGLQGTKLLSALQDVTLTEDGNLYVAGDGTLTWKGRAARITQIRPRWVLGSNVPAGEIPFLGDITYSADPQYVYGQVTCNRPKGVTVSTQDATSVLQNFPRTLTRTLNVDTDDQVLDMTSVLLQRLKQPSKRVGTVTFRPAAHPRAFWAALSMELGDRVTINQRPSDGSPAIGLDFYLEKIEHEITSADWTVRLQLSPVPSTVYKVMGALRTTLNTASLAAATSLVLNPLGDAARNPVEANIAPGTVWRADPGTPADESFGVTGVTSSTPGLSGYATATLTVARTLLGSPTLSTALGISPDPAGATVALSAVSNASVTALIIDGEVMTVTAGAGTASLTVTRGAGVTSQAPHLVGAAVVQLGAGLQFAHPAGAVVCEQLSGADIVPSVYDPATLIGSVPMVLQSTVAANVSAIGLLPLNDWPRNTHAADIGTGQVLWLDTAGSQERMQVLSVGATNADGTVAVQFGSWLTASCLNAATTVTVAAPVTASGSCGWVAGQKVGVTTGTTFATVNTVTDNHNGTVTLALSAGTPSALEIGAVLYQFTVNAHTAGAVVSDASSSQAGAALAA